MITPAGMTKSVIALVVLRMRRFYERTWEIWVLLCGHLSAFFFLTNLAAGLESITEPRVRAFTRGLYELSQLITQGPVPLARVAVIIFVILLIQALRGRSIRWAADVFGVLLSLRCLAQFLILNLLLLAPLQQGALLLMQLILFLPVITLNFGWLYWRFDNPARRLQQPQIRFEEEPPGAFDYFHIAANTLLQFEPTGAKPLTRRMKSLFTLHGLVMMDLVALTLSRAIGLATTG